VLLRSEGGRKGNWVDKQRRDKVVGVRERGRE